MPIECPTYRAAAVGCQPPPEGVPPPGFGPRPAPSPGSRRFRSVGAGIRAQEEVAMRVESSVTSLSWIPSEAVTGANKPVFEIGVAHYDDPPPDVLADLDELRDS